MAWQNSQSTWIVVVNLIILILLAYASWRRRSHFAARLYLYFLICIFGTRVIYLVQSLSAEPDLIAFMERASHLPWQLAAVTALLFIKAYIGQEAWITRRRVIALMGIATFLALIVLADGSLHLYYESVDVASVDGLLTARPVYNPQSPVFWMARLYPLVIGLYVTYLLLTELRRPHTLYRQRAVLILITAVLTMGIGFLNFTGSGDLRTSDLFSLGMALPALPIALSFYRLKFLDLTPIANDVVIRDLADAVLVVDMQQNVVGLNPAAEHLLGQPERALVGNVVEAVLPPEWYRCLRTAIDTGEHATLEIAKDTASRHYAISTSPLSDSRGKPLGFVAVFRDVSALKQMEERAISLAVEQERNQLMQGMLHDVAHDLRTPLTELELNAHLLQRGAQAATQDVAELRLRGDAATPGQALDDLGGFVVRVDERAVQINQCAERLRTIFDTMFEFVRLDSGQDIEMQPSDLNQLVREMCEAVQTSIDAKQIAVHLMLADGLPLAHLNRDQFARAIRNLIENAVHYSATGGEIRLQTSHQGDQICLTVADEGIGISAEDMPRIFEAFFRADKARQPDSGAIGMGLAMTRRIVRAHGGTINAESTPGVGTCFRVLLPTQREPALP